MLGESSIFNELGDHKYLGWKINPEWLQIPSYSINGCSNNKSRGDLLILANDNSS